MRICLVSYEFPPRAGGEGVYTSDLMSALQSSGSEVLLLTPNWSNSNTERDSSRVHVNPLEIPGMKTTSFMLRANRKLKQLSDRFDVVHYTNDYCGFGASRSEIGKPVLATIHHTHSLEASSVAPHLNGGTAGRAKFSISETMLRRMERGTLKNADMVVAVSRFTAENALAIYPFLQGRIKVVLNAVDDGRFNPCNDSSLFRNRVGLGKSQTILYVGRLAVSKGIRFLIEAFKEVVSDFSEAKLVIVGSGSSEEEHQIKLLIDKLALSNSVMLAGPVSAEDLPKAYSACDLVVLPSLVEGFGLVLLEGMASGKPVVATRLGPTEEIVSDGVEGLLVPKADSHLLAQGISSILSNHSLATSMGRAGRKKIEERFSLKRWASEMTGIYQELSQK